MVPREDPHLAARVAQGLDDIPPDHLPKHRGHVSAVEQVAEDAEQGGAMLDRPPSGFREVPVEVQCTFRDPRFRVDPEIEAQAFVDIAHADDLVHPGVRKATLLLIMSTKRSAKVSNHRSRLGNPPPTGRERRVGANGLPVREPGGAQRYEGFGPLARGDVLGDEATAGRRVLESMAAEADLDEEAIGANSIEARLRSGSPVVGTRPSP